MLGASRMIGRYVIALVSLLVLHMRAEGAINVGITYVTEAVASGAVCLDGSPPAYHFSEGFGSGINNWLVHFQGGAWCQDVSSCISRRDTSLGSSALMETVVNFYGLLNNEEEFNPDFYNWNRIFVRYCDGGSYTGDVEAVDPVTNLHFRGARVFQAVMENLLSRGMKNAQNAIMSGCSAGGLTSILHCDKFKALLPSGARVKCLSDAGYFVNANDISGAPFIEEFYSQVVATHGSANNLPASCTSRMKPSLCFFPENVVEQIQTPIFFLNAAHDSWQIANILAPPDSDPSGVWYGCKTNIQNCTPEQLKIIQDFRMEFLTALRKASRFSPHNGMFIDGCFAHCQSEAQQTWFSAPVVGNATISRAVGDWYYDRNGFHKKIDCAYPCNPTC
ncbi:hypothetical protein SAY87_021072 [Trapa incisa]|uniref:Pectin acetylesterase n=1 Tax=Trapa incisa TaxID=236973 RepID=A0AAN7JRJ6_9MYRT|nr:hypothetical protein SAY87_021072 [Trapa incisa]